MLLKLTQLFQILEQALLDSVFPVTYQEWSTLLKSVILFLQNNVSAN